METFSVYCDESCHLEHDKSQYMVLGCIYVNRTKLKVINKRIKDIKNKHGFTSDYEIKWTKLRAANLGLATDLVKLFVKDPDIKFRGYIIDKSNLDHESRGQTHDDWYYKMYFRTLEFIMRPGSSYKIFLDVKDTRSGAKIKKLNEVLINNMKKYGSYSPIEVYAMQSYESQLIQICDLFIGAIRYKKCKEVGSKSKLLFISCLEDMLGASITSNKYSFETKFNTYNWSGF